MLRHLAAGKLYVESAGVRAGELDPMAVEVMEEVGPRRSASTRPRCFEDLEDGSFDLVITLSPEAQHKAMETDPYRGDPGGILAHTLDPLHGRGVGRANSGSRRTGRCATSLMERLKAAVSLARACSHDT